MDVRTKLRCFRWCTYIGSFLLLCPSFLPWYWGNLSVYTDSYFRATLGPDSGYDKPWTISVFLTLEAFAINLYDFINNYLGNHIVLFIVIVVYNSTVFLCYLAIQKSVTALVLTAGSILGFSYGIILGHVLYTVRSWCTPKYVGLHTALVLTGLNIGPLAIIQIVTHYINPNNKAPDLVVNERAYFTQQDILDRVPSVFIVIGTVSLLFHVCGLLLTRDIKHAQLFLEDNNDRSTQDNKYLANLEKNEEENCIHNSADGAQEEFKSANKLRISMTDTRSNSDEEIRRYTSDSFRMESLPQTHSKGTEHVNKHESEELCPQTDNHSQDLSPKQLLKNYAFYTIWFCMLCSDFSFLMTTNFYKSYGQSRISDDHFLANTGTVALICLFLTRPLWGIMIDYLGTKNTLIFFAASVSLGSAFWFFTPLINKWFYLIWTVILGIVNGGFFVVFPLAVLKMFGPTYHLSNYGLVMTSSLSINLGGPFVINVIFSNFGFFGLFCTSSILAAIGLISIVPFFPRFELY